MKRIKKKKKGEENHISNLLCLFSGIAYTLFFGLFVNLARWSYGYNLLQKKSYDQETDEPIEYTGSNYGSISSSSEGRRSSSFTATEDMETNSIDEIAKYKYSNEQCRLLSSNKTSCTDTRLVTCFMNALSSLNKYMSPPLYAALLALIVGLIPPLKHVMYDKDSFVYVTLTMAIDSCGKVSVPVVMICLGAQLKSIRETQQAASPQMRKPVILTIFIRMFLTPLCVLPLAYLFAKYGQAWSELAADPMFIVSAVIIGCTPTAISLAQITQVSGIFEEEMLHVLFWSYGVICIPACTLIVFLALAIIS